MSEMSRAEKMLRRELTQALEMVTGTRSAAEGQMRPDVRRPLTPKVGEGLRRVFHAKTKGEAEDRFLLEVIVAEELSNDLIISLLQECIGHLEACEAVEPAPPRLSLVSPPRQN